MSGFYRLNKAYIRGRIISFPKISFYNIAGSNFSPMEQRSFCLFKRESVLLLVSCMPYNQCSLPKDFCCFMAFLILAAMRSGDIGEP